MRLMQCNKAHTILDGAKILFKSKGLYRGYQTALLEDCIEMDIRMKLYSKCRDDSKHLSYNVAIGTLATSFAAALVTPFDIVRTNMCLNAAALQSKTQHPLYVACQIVANHGPVGLYRGGLLRFTSHGIKNISYFLVYEFLRRKYLLGSQTHA
jgi:hypothetical protein